MAIEVFYAGFKVVNSGSIVCSEDKEILFKVDDLTIKIVFKTDKDKPSAKQEYTTKDGIAQLCLINYDIPEGIGFVNMWDLLNGYFFNYRVYGNQNSEAGKIFHYSIFKNNI